MSVLLTPNVFYNKDHTLLGNGKIYIILKDSL